MIGDRSTLSLARVWNEDNMELLCAAERGGNVDDVCRRRKRRTKISMLGCMILSCSNILIENSKLVKMIEIAGSLWTMLSLGYEKFVCLLKSLFNSSRNACNMTIIVP